MSYPIRPVVELRAGGGVISNTSVCLILSDLSWNLGPGGGVISNTSVCLILSDLSGNLGPGGDQ